VCALSWAWSRGSVAWRVVTMFKQLRHLERVELWIAWLDPCSCFKSRTLNLSQPRIFDTSHYWTLEPLCRSRLSFAWFKLLNYTFCYRKGQDIRAQTPSSGKRACTTTNSAYLELVSLHSAAVCQSCRTTFCMNNVSTHILVLPGRAHEEHRIRRTRPSRQ
jgi:hypothetical protein